MFRLMVLSSVIVEVTIPRGSFVFDQSRAYVTEPRGGAGAVGEVANDNQWKANAYKQTRI